MKYTVEMAADSIIQVPSFMKIQVILGLKLRQSKRLQCWYY
jgi:hypothetical protein